jgi:hypothetical protein
MYFEYFKRGKCDNCGDVIWVEKSGATGGIICRCGNASIIKGIETNLSSCTDEEHIKEVKKDYLVEDIPTINIIKL